jgi:micrococcal nuclease
MRTALALLMLLLSLPAAACSPASVAAPSTAQDLTPTPTTVILVPPEVLCEWARVRSVTDGDTIRVDFEAGARNQPVRYIGIDTPETRHPTLGVQPFGLEASDANTALVAGKRVCLEKDISESDRYDRLLRYIWLEDGRMVNEVLVAEGFATTDTFPPDVKYVERFLAAQQSAAAEGLGIWAE